MDSTRQNQPAAVAVGSHHFCRGEVLRLAIDEGTFQGDRTFCVTPWVTTRAGPGAVRISRNSSGCSRTFFTVCWLYFDSQNLFLKRTWDSHVKSYIKSNQIKFKSIQVLLS